MVLFELAIILIVIAIAAEIILFWMSDGDINLFVRGERRTGAIPVHGFRRGLHSRLPTRAMRSIP